MQISHTGRGDRVCQSRKREENEIGFRSGQYQTFYTQKLLFLLNELTN